MSPDGPWRLSLGAKEERYLAGLPRKECLRLLNALDALRADPFALDVVALKGREGYRLRVGRWRVIFGLDHEARQIAVLAIGPRGDIYK